MQSAPESKRSSQQSVAAVQEALRYDAFPRSMAEYNKSLNSVPRFLNSRLSGARARLLTFEKALYSVRAAVARTPSFC